VGRVPPNLYHITWRNHPVASGAHKVRATCGCLARTLVAGAFDSSRQKPAWASTGNVRRDGAYNHSGHISENSFMKTPE
jgi:hypothetical protein